MKMKIKILNSLLRLIKLFLILLFFILLYLLVIPFTLLWVVNGRDYFNYLSAATKMVDNLDRFIKK